MRSELKSIIRGTRFSQIQPFLSDSAPLLVFVVIIKKKKKRSVVLFELLSPEKGNKHLSSNSNVTIIPSLQDTALLVCDRIRLLRHTLNIS